MMNGKMRSIFTNWAVIAALALVLVACDDMFASRTGPETPGNTETSNEGMITLSGEATATAVTPPASSLSQPVFTLTGNSKNDYYNYTLAAITKGAFAQNSPTLVYYLIRGDANGDFSQDINLRYGAGSYTLVVVDLTQLQVSLNGEGFVYGFGGNLSQSFTLTYESGDATKDAYDAWQILPSANVQSADSRIVTLKNTIFSGAGLTGESSQTAKIRAINKWLVLNLYYDDASLVNGQRKKQDAISVILNQTGVCEGYAHLGVALARAAGIRASYVESVPMNHAWMQAQIDGTWYMFDPTWNDPTDQNGNSITNANWNANISYGEGFFKLPGTTGMGADATYQHTGGVVNTAHSVVGPEPSGYISVRFAHVD
jgi:hypothetical protein